MAINGTTVAVAISSTTTTIATTTVIHVALSDDDDDDDDIASRVCFSPTLRLAVALLALALSITIAIAIAARHCARAAPRLAPTHHGRTSAATAECDAERRREGGEGGG